MIYAYLIRTLKQPKLFISVLGVFAMCMMRLTNGAFTADDLVGDLDLLVNIDAFRKVIVVFSAVPFASVFADEWNHKMTISCVLRSTPKKYAWSQVVVCFTTAFLVTLLGFILFLVVNSFRMPIYIPDGNPTTPPYGVLLEKNMPLIHLLVISVNFSISCAMWSVTGLLMSAIFPNTFIAVCTPFIASYMLERITLNFPDKLNLLYVALSRISILDNPIVSFLYVIVVFCGLTIIFGYTFSVIVEKRVKNEMG
ncbi:MAG: hypothetical protein J6A37_06715 [Oscillospiraceae bacterium]|nr:hypothetical protein [Oscillospiraceae bacterium]